MLIPKTIEDIKALIAQGQQEGLNLEYKGAAALGTSDGKKNEIAKDVSAMANSDGGIIIYGVREFDEVNKKHLPEGVDPVIRAGFTKEQLEQIIQSNIRPKIEGLKIYPISLLDPDHVIYIVEIPQSTTCHQAKDKKYYKRHNFESVPMEHYEILDVLNRAKHPSIDLEFFMIKDESKIILQFYPINAGVIIAHHINYVVQIQSDVLNFKESCLSTKSISENSKIEYRGDNTFGGIFYPILPCCKWPHYKSSFILLNKAPENLKELSWVVYADNATPRTGLINLKDLYAMENGSFNLNSKINTFAS